MASTEVFQLIEYAELKPNETVGWWYNELPDDGSVYIPLAYPWGFSDGSGVGPIPEKEVEVTNVKVYRSPGEVTPVSSIRGHLALGFDVQNKMPRGTSYTVFLAKMTP